MIRTMSKFVFCVLLYPAICYYLRPKEGAKFKRKAEKDFISGLFRDLWIKIFKH